MDQLIFKVILRQKTEGVGCDTHPHLYNKDGNSAKQKQLHEKLSNNKVCKPAEPRLFLVVRG